MVLALVVAGLLVLLPGLVGCRSISAVDCPQSPFPVEKGLQPEAQMVLRCIHQEFPQITTYHGKRKDPLPDHPSGLAIDIMIDSAEPDYRSPAGATLGDAVVAYLQDHKDDLRLDYLIWRQSSWKANRADDDWYPMKSRGSDNANHFNHIHVTVLGVGQQLSEAQPRTGEKPPPAAEPTPTPTVEEPSPTPLAQPLEIADPHLVEAGTDSRLAQACPGGQVQVVADVTSGEALAGVTLSMSGALSSGPSPMAEVGGATYRSNTIGLNAFGTITLTIVATDASGSTRTAQSTLTLPAAGDCSELGPFTIS